MLTYKDLLKGFEFGPWMVLPERDLIRNGDEERHLEPLVMDVFVVLASGGGDVVARDTLIEKVWGGRPQADEVITRCISALRRSLGDNAKNPEYIETLQKRGYRVMKRVRLAETAVTQRPTSRSFRPVYVAMLVLLATALLGLARLLHEESAPASTEGPINAVAVYPFDCKQDASNPSEHLCFGFAEEAIGRLKSIPGLEVVRMRLPYAGIPPPGVEGIVTGSVQIIDDRARIAAFLEDTRSGLAICCDTFDATRRSIFDTQKSVARALSEALGGNGTQAGPDPAETASFDAKMAYSLGRFLFERRDHQSIAAAIEQFEKAIALHPGYGAAWLGLAYTYVNWPDYDLAVDRAAMYDKALEVIARGIAADPGIREAAGTVFGFVYHKRNEWLLAADSFEMATAAEIEQPIAYHWYSYFLASVGRLDEALKQALHALQLDPDNPSTISRVAIIALYKNDHEMAARYFEMAELMGLANYQHSLTKALLLYREGRFDEAKSSGREGLELGDVDASWFDLIVDGSRDPALKPRAVQALERISSMHVLPANVEMPFWVLLGETERALAIARRLETEVGLYELELIFLDEFRAMRGHPQFVEFVEAIGLGEYWASAGCSWTNDRVRCR